MGDSDDEFKELCANLLKRVKRKPVAEAPTVLNPSTAARSKLKKHKPAGGRSQAGNGGNKGTGQGTTAGGKSDRALAEKNEQCDIDGTDRAPGTYLGHLSNGSTHTDSSRGHGTVAPSEAARPQGEPHRPTEVILQRMQQFKRADPARLRLNTAGTGDPEVLPSVGEAPQSDDAVALQMDLGEQQRGLEDEGLFFCQLCQKDLTAMCTALRQQHVNR
ncbi:hypothetical protein FKM82_029215 [Ascaphus truei]